MGYKLLMINRLIRDDSCTLQESLFVYPTKYLNGENKGLSKR
ncbi:hypothetical protein J2T13_004701 [Paenibacillus sp. DS2015]